MRILFALFILALVSSCASNNFSGGSIKPAPYYKVGNPYQIGDNWYYPQEDPNYSEVGVASWYGSDFHGKRTANGDVFDQNALTGAHRTLPMPSMVRVTNLENNKSANVIINDRGPFAKSRILDVSKKTSQVLGFNLQGTAKVKVEYLPEESRELVAKLDPEKAKSMEFVQTGSSIKPSNKVVVVEAKELNVGKLPYDLVSNSSPEFTATSLDSSAVTSNSSAMETVKVASNNVASTSGDVYVQAGAFSVEGNANKAFSDLSDIGNVVVEKVDNLYRVRIGPVADKKTAELFMNKAISLGYADAVVVAK